MFKKEIFPLKTVICNYAFVAKNVDESLIDFDYHDDDFIHVWCDSDSDSDQSKCFDSSVCFSRKGYNLSFRRFFLRCKHVLLRYFTREVHVIKKSLL